MEELDVAAPSRLRELALHVLSAAVPDPRFDLARLQDVLFLSDALATAELGHSITGTVYEKSSSGPSARAHLLEELGSTVLSLPVASAAPTLVALRPPAPVFGDEELELVDRVLGEVLFSSDEDLPSAHDWLLEYRQTFVGEELPVNLTSLDPEPFRL